MTDQEFEFILTDRIAKIQAIDAQYNLCENAYIAFSGGKDSIVLSHLIDIALPRNKIPRIYANTGIEFVDMAKFVKKLSTIDDRIVIVSNSLNIPKTLKEKGYPFKSKKHSQFINIFQKSGLHYGIENYIKLSCPKCLKYQFSPDFKMKISSQCCINFKEK